MDEMIKQISNYSNGTYLKVEWEYGQLVLEGKIDTIYESDNGLDEDDDGYKEFYACAFRIEKIISNEINKSIVLNSLIEISIENTPTKITLQDGNILWEKLV